MSASWAATASSPCPGRCHQATQLHMADDPERRDPRVDRTRICPGALDPSSITEMNSRSTRRRPAG